MFKLTNATPLRKYDNLSIRIFYCNVMDAPLSYSDTELANMTTAHDQDIFNGLKQSVSNYDFSIFSFKDKLHKQ